MYRFFGAGNGTEGNPGNVYGLETYLLETLAQSEHRCVHSLPLNEPWFAGERALVWGGRALVCC